MAMLLEMENLAPIAQQATAVDSSAAAPSAIKLRGQAFIENENVEEALVLFVRRRALRSEEMPYVVRQ